MPSDRPQQHHACGKGITTLKDSRRQRRQVNACFRREMETEIEIVRLRLVFKNHHILSKSQRKEGLAKSWFLFKPKLHKTISDLSAYLLHIFGLHHSCPHGLLLSMDGFALLPFESTCVLKDKDVCEKEAGVSAEIDDLDNGLEIVKLLANEEFDKETGGYESEFEEDEHEESLHALDLEDKPVVDKVSKKRKALNSKKLQGSKRKKSKLASAKESLDIEDVENDVHVVKSGNSHRVHKKNQVKKDKSSNVQKSSSPEIDETNNCIMRKAKRTGKAGVPCTAYAIFGAVKDVGANASSEHSVCFAVPEKEVKAVAEALQSRFRKALDVFPRWSLANINVCAIAQGYSEYNITVVIKREDCIRARRAVHSRFYLSRTTKAMGIIGPGLIGATLLNQLRGQAAILKEEFNIELCVMGITGSEIMLLSDIGTLSYLFINFVGTQTFSEVVSEAKAAGHTEPDPRDNLSGTDVARKVIILARESGLKLELADLPVQSLVPEPFKSKKQYFSFLDSIEVCASVGEFMEKLPQFDQDLAKERQQAEDAGEVLRYVGEVDAINKKGIVELRRYKKDHPFALLSGSDNIIAFTTTRYKEQPLIVRGSGTGAQVTASGEKEPTEVHCPVVEMPTRCKLSCLSWSKCTKSQISSSDYEGIVTVLDSTTSQNVMEYEEHEKRASSVDFSCSEPAMLVSGSDDCKHCVVISLVTCKAVIDLSLSACVTAIQVVLEGEMETEIERVQLRLVFENHHILSKSQQKEGLAKSWFLFKPKLHKTISDLSAYLLHIFGLQHSCPHGLLLSMDGFALPPFESTCVLKDKDVAWSIKLLASVVEYEEHEKRASGVDFSCSEASMLVFGSDDRKVGDVIAYRLIELSSCWTAEPTSFRVGKISWISGRLFLNGSSVVASLFTQQGKKGTDQDAMLVWENFASRKDTVFCGVFDGHGPMVTWEISLNAAGSINSEDTAFVSADNFTILEDGCIWQSSNFIETAKFRRGDEDGDRESAVAFSVREPSQTGQVTAEGRTRLKLMDGFALPPFESTCVLKDKDNLPANEEFDKEIGGYESEFEEDEHEESGDALDLEDTPVVDKVSKKWKASNSNKLQGSKRIKSKLASAKESVDLEDVENDVHVVKSGNSHCVHKKNRVKKDKSSDVQGEPEKSSPPAIDETNNCIMRKAKSVVFNLSVATEGSQQPDSSCGSDDDFVPVVIRPGHIRFEVPGKGDADQAVQQNYTPVRDGFYSSETELSMGSITSEDVLREISLNAAGSINSEDTAFVSADNFTLLEDGCSNQRSCGVGGDEDGDRESAVAFSVREPSQTGQVTAEGRTRLKLMDGFALPPFESTCILKDKDVVCVRKKVGVSAEIDDLDIGLEIVKLLANEEFDKEADLEDTNVSKKWKALKVSRKKSKLAGAKESLDLEDVENDVHVVKSGNYHCIHKKNHVKKDKSSNVQGEPEKSSSPQIDETNNCIMRKAKSFFDIFITIGMDLCSFCRWGEFSEAVILKKLSYQEAWEMSYFGANVLHPRTIIPVMRYANYNLALVNIEGTGMAGVPCTANAIFGAVKDVGANVIMISQVHSSSETSSEHSVCFAVPEKEVKAVAEALQFYLSRTTKAMGIIGPGLIGATLLDQLRGQTAVLKEEFNIDLRVMGITGSETMLLSDMGIDLLRWRELLKEKGEVADLEKFTHHVCGNHFIPNTVFVDLFKIESSSMEIIHTHYFYEATVGAGFPIISTLRGLLETGDKVLHIEGMFSGTLSYLFNNFVGTQTFSEVVSEAKAAGYTEPDPRDNQSGTDVARKVIILARESGLKLELADLPVQSLVPEPFKSKKQYFSFLDSTEACASAGEFMEKLPQFDQDLAKERQQAEDAGEFDFDNELFATAGVSSCIKIFEFSTVSIGHDSLGCTQMRSHHSFKALCCKALIDLSISASVIAIQVFTKSQIASSDYEGIVTVLDATTSQNVMEYEEHEKRASSVDFSCSEPAMLVSGSDDCKFLQSTVLLFSLVTCKAVIDLSLSACVTAIQVMDGFALPPFESTCVLKDKDVAWSIKLLASVVEYEEHEKRASSVDFSCSEASMLVSGSDDRKVKIWCTRQEASVPSIDMKANICSVSIIPDPVGDVIAYRLIELSSCWTAEPTSFRVGKISWEVVLEWIECGCFTLYQTRQKGNEPRCHACLGVSITGEDVLREISLNAAGSINSEDTAFVSADNFTILEDGCSMQIMETEIERVQLRLVFENHHILSKSQRKEGLAKSLFLFKPKLHKTISDLSAYLLHIFGLQHYCPHGLLLSVDGFALPPFESTYVLKVKAVVGVRKKVRVSAEIDDLDNGLEILKLLANEEFDKETGGVNLKRMNMRSLCMHWIWKIHLLWTKFPRKGRLQIRINFRAQSMRIKSKLASAKESVDLEDVENDVHVAKSGNSHCIHKKNRVKDKSSDVQGEPKKSSPPDIDETNNCIMRKVKRSLESLKYDVSSMYMCVFFTYSACLLICKLSKNRGIDELVFTTYFCQLKPKLPSRSARRKKANRRWLREQAKIEKLELLQKEILSKDNQQSLDRDDRTHEHQQPNETSHDKDSEKLSEGQQPDSSCGSDDDFVPVVIRPGHIRFEVPGKGDADQAVQQNHTPVWNGITSKKKGQNWGTEKASFS
ncbi:hypothetical protein EZV62_022682 [Acer yangbiense]|uniref:Uncharacterized protein n=1 Tax=Acer yangbiense TaxID=1000413 RepID=A0A5C7H8R0_9ROSI|nr:hypothetical protein EZV62_022682 [Acer yangbiense]